MAQITGHDVKAIAPELSSVDDGSVTAQVVLAYVHDSVPIGPFDGEGSPRLRMARILAAAHLGKMSVSGGAAPAGPVTSESDGGLSRSYAAPSMSSTSSSWESTTYGRQYLQMLRTSTMRLPRIA